MGTQTASWQILNNSALGGFTPLSASLSLNGSLPTPGLNNSASYGPFANGFNFVFTPLASNANLLTPPGISNSNLYGSFLSVSNPLSPHLSSTPIRPYPLGVPMHGAMPSPLHCENPFAEYPSLSAFPTPPPSAKTLKRSKPKKLKKSELPKLTSSERTQMNSFIIRHFAHAEDPNSLPVEAGRMSMQCIRVPTSMKPADQASKSTLRRRAKLSEKIRKISKSKLSAELSRMPHPEKVMECNEAGVSAPLFTPHDDLAMRTYAGLSGVQMEKIKKFEASKGIRRSTLNTQRELKKSLVGEFLETKPCEFTFKDQDSPYAVNGMIKKSLPLCLVKDLTQFTLHQINENHKLGKLTWHGGIPQDEIWVKIPGDKGGGSTKLGIQIVNVENPNSPANTALICQFEASDSYDNLKAALSGTAQQVIELKSAKWNGKKITVFGGGDCDYTLFQNSDDTTRYNSGS